MPWVFWLCPADFHCLEVVNLFFINSVSVLDWNSLLIGDSCRRGSKLTPLCQDTEFNPKIFLLSNNEETGSVSQQVIKMAFCSLHFLAATLKLLLNFRPGTHLCYTECKMWVNNCLKKWQTLLLPSLYWSKIMVESFMLLFLFTGGSNQVKSVQLLAWELFQMLRNIQIAYLAEHTNANVKNIFNM